METQQIGKVLLIGINRPEKRNAVDPDTAEHLVEAFTQFEKDPDSLVAVLYGKGLLIIHWVQPVSLHQANMFV